MFSLSACGFGLGPRPHGPNKPLPSGPSRAPLRHKALVAPKPTISATGAIDAELLAASVIARGRLQDLHSESGADTADTVMAMLRQHLPSLLVVDSDFVVEASLVEHLCGTSSEDRLLNHILAAFPSQAKQVSMEDCLQAHGRVGGLDSGTFGFAMQPEGCHAMHRYGASGSPTLDICWVSIGCYSGVWGLMHVTWLASHTMALALTTLGALAQGSCNRHPRTKPTR